MRDDSGDNSVSFLDFFFFFLSCLICRAMNR